MDKDKNLTLFLILLLYFGLRLSYSSTIEFGYDQPRLATVVIDFLKNGNFINSQQFSLATSWGNFSWGPLLIFFNLPFIFISKNPYIISGLMIFFNVLSLVFIFLISKEFFSRRVALLSTLLMAVFPWWIIFSRMIYQPTPIPTFISMSIYFLFKSIKKPDSYWLLLLIFSWVLLIQSYLITVLFIAISALILMILAGKKIINRYLFFSCLLVIFLFLPSIKFYINNPEMFYKFISFKEKFSTTLKESMLGFVNTLSGNNFKWQLGYGYELFLTKYPNLRFISLFNYINFGFTFLAGIYLIFIKPNVYKIVNLLLLFIVLFTLPYIGVEHVVPRYFLYILPQFAIFFADTWSNLLNKYGRILLIPLFILLSGWIVWTLNYFEFVRSFNYPNGFLSNWSDVPYSFLDKSFKWIIVDANNKKYDSFIVSSDLEYPYEFRLNTAQRYYWYNILNRDEQMFGKVGNYLMYYSPVSEKFLKKDQQFGPYIISDVTNSSN